MVMMMKNRILIIILIAFLAVSVVIAMVLIGKNKSNNNKEQTIQNGYEIDGKEDFAKFDEIMLKDFIEPEEIIFENFTRPDEITLAEDFTKPEEETLEDFTESKEIALEDNPAKQMLNAVTSEDRKAAVAAYNSKFYDMYEKAPVKYSKKILDSDDISEFDYDKFHVSFVGLHARESNESIAWLYLIDKYSELKNKDASLIRIEIWELSIYEGLFVHHVLDENDNVLYIASRVTEEGYLYSFLFEP